MIDAGHGDLTQAARSAQDALENITHVILFLSDMGANSVVSLSPAWHARATDVIDELLDLFTAILQIDQLP